MKQIDHKARVLQVVGISGAMDYVITPEGNRFSCEHGAPPLDPWGP